MPRYVVLVSLREFENVVVAADARVTRDHDDLGDVVRRMTAESYLHAAPSVAHRFIVGNGRSLKSEGRDGGLPLLIVDISERNADVLSSHSDVLSIELDRPIRVFDVEQQPGHALDRIDQRSLPLDGLYHHLYDGANVDIYVLDSGVRASHNEFVGRIVEGRNFADDQPADDVDDCQGHGTHVASLALGTRFGVAKKAALIPIRIYDCSNTGSLSQALLGIDYALRTMRSRGGRRSIVSMSFGGENSPTLDAAMIRIEELGAVVVAAAGNDGIDACVVSPANGRGVIAVGSVNIADTFSSFSNHGPCVALSAPGENVMGADFQSDDGVRVMSGTSMSTPIVAGAVATFFSFAPDTTINEARSAVICGATVNGVKDAPFGTTARLLYADPSSWADAARDHECSVSHARQTSPHASLALIVMAVTALSAMRLTKSSRRSA